MLIGSDMNKYQRELLLVALMKHGNTMAAWRFLNVRDGELGLPHSDSNGISLSKLSQAGYIILENRADRDVVWVYIADKALKELKGE